jgi:lipopolysaccharide export system protein LptA
MAKVPRMRLTIERLRTMVLAAGVLLVVALSVFLGLAKFRNPFSRKDLPQKLGLNIAEEANGFVYTHEVRGHTLYKIHASKQLQLKKDGQLMLQLHDVKIELYAEDGSRVDRIEGAEFEYDPKAGLARATGPVVITLMRPQVAPAIAPKVTTDRALSDATMNSTLTAAAQTASGGEIEVRTSGLVFDRNSGAASTKERVDFALAQGSGSAIGAAYDAHAGVLVLDHAVELTTKRGEEPVTMRAQHAEFLRAGQVGSLRAVTVNYRDTVARAEAAKVNFRDDGSAERLDADQGFSLVTGSGGRLAAPKGTLEFDARNRPLFGHMEGGVTIDSNEEDRNLHGSSPTMDMKFSADGELKSAHLERGVQISSEEETGATDEAVRTGRSWASPVVDVAFRSSGKGKTEPASIHGMGGVVVTTATQRGNGPVSPSKLAAEEVTGTFDAKGGLKAIEGTGHASMEQTTAAGIRQTTSGDKLVAHLAAAEKRAKGSGHGQPTGSMEIESATVAGNVVLGQQPAARGGAAAEPAMRATAGQAVYEGAGEWLHLAQSPRVTDGGLQIAADRIDVSQASGDAAAHGNVKATWLGNAPGDAKTKNGTRGGTGSVSLGAQGPAHAVASEARLDRASGQVTFQGKARLWQQGNSIAAPVIVLDRTRQTLTARSTSAAEPVQVVMVSAAALVGKDNAAKATEPSVIRVRGGDLKYSSAERKAVVRGGAAGSVVASTAEANTTSSELELVFLPPGNHAGRDGTSAQVDSMTSRGHVVVSSQGRRGTGEKLVYSSETGNYVLTGTAEAPPRITDPVRGTVTGEALVFNSRDDSVSIEGEGRRTTTITSVPEARKSATHSAAN